MAIDQGLEDKNDVPGGHGDVGNALVDLEGKGVGAEGLDDNRGKVGEPGVTAGDARGAGR